MVTLMPQQDRHALNLYQASLSGNWFGYVPGNQATLLHNGKAYFTAIEAAIDQAGHDIYLETYIYENDATGQRIGDALKRAASRGVKVYVLVDGYGSQNLPRSMLDRLRKDGVKILTFRPKIAPWTFQRQRLRRMHRKILVVDRSIAFVGGINIVDDKGTEADMSSRYDYAVAVEGPVVDVIRLSAQRLWSRVAWNSFRKGMVHDGPLPVSTFIAGSMRAAFLMRDNFHHRRDIEGAYLQAIRQAKSEIILANAYFLPGINFRHALINAAARGVRVVLLLQGKVEFFLEHYGSRALYGHFLDAGIEIFEYHKSFLHAKVAVIDGHWATVGSSNIDPFSLLLSLEANLVIDDEAFGATLSQSLKRTVEADGQQILSADWKRKSAGLRFLSWLCYGLLRLMQGISGYAGENSWAKNE